jgi:hypothetical protein
MDPFRTVANYPEHETYIGHRGARALSMPEGRCFFCDHTNPAAAKFCNECGSPLHLKLCAQCEAINDRAARTCYQCGATDSALGVTPEVVAETPGGQNLDATPPIVSRDLGAPGGQTLDATPPIISRDLGAPGGQTLDATLAVVSQNVRAAAKWRSSSRVAMVAAPPLVLLSALAAFAYFAYTHSVQLKEWLSMIAVTVDPGGRGTPISVTGMSGLPASSTQTESVGAATVAAAEPAVLSRTTGPAPDLAISPVRLDPASATGATGADGLTPTSDKTSAAATSRPQASAGEQASTAPAAAHVKGKTSTSGKTTAKKTKKAEPSKTRPAQATPSTRASTTTVAAPKTAERK